MTVFCSWGCLKRVHCLTFQFQCVLRYDHHCPCTRCFVLYAILNSNLICELRVIRDRPVCRRTKPQGISCPHLIFLPLFTHFPFFALQYFINFNQATVVFTAYVLATLITFTVKESNATFMSDIDPQKIVLIGLYVFPFSHTSCLAYRHAVPPFLPIPNYIVCS